MSSSAVLTCNLICWLFSSSSALTSTTKQSFLVLPHLKNDHAALITQALQGIPSHHWQQNNIHLQFSVPPRLLAPSGLRLGEGDRLELFIEPVCLLISFPGGPQQRDWCSRRYREHPGPPAEQHSGFGSWPRILTPPPPAPPRCSPRL